jgi:hypothetical protein
MVSSARSFLQLARERVVLGRVAAARSSALDGRGEQAREGRARGRHAGLDVGAEQQLG